MGILSAIFGVFKRNDKKKPNFPSDMDPADIPTQYWPEVQSFVENLREIVNKNTIEDKQAQKMNQQVIDFLEQQIEKKGYSGTYEDKCQAMEMMADRVLSSTVNRFIGIREKEDQTTEFSDLVNDFKQQIDKRKQSIEAH